MGAMCSSEYGAKENKIRKAGAGKASKITHSFEQYLRQQSVSADRFLNVSGSDHSSHFKRHLRKVQQQPVFPTRRLQVRSYDRKVNIFQILDRLQLQHDRVFHKQIETMASYVHI